MADRRRRAFWTGAVLLFGVTLAAYFPALRGGFVWDDDSFLTQNNIVKAANGLHRFWFTTDPSDFWPVTSTVLWVEWRLWGMDAVGYHAVNLALHIGEAFLLWGVLRRLRVPGAYVAALLFAVHPVNVESVAWIAQLKNLMAMLFYLLSIWFFLGSESDQSRRGAYAASLLCFTLAMLSKGSVAILPLILLGIIAWRRAIGRRDLLRIAPYFVVATVLAATDVWFQRHGLRVEFRHAGVLERLLGAGAVVWFYLYKALLPINLIFVYPAWQIRAGNPLWWTPLIAAAGATAVLWHYRGSAARPALFAWGYFCAALVPVMGFTDVYFMKYSLVADHYQHIAIIGVIGFVAAAWAGWEEKWHGLPARGGEHGLEAHATSLPRIVAAAVIGVLACLTWRQCGMYRDAETLYSTILARNPQAWLAENNLANVMFRSGRFREAIPHYREALILKPDLSEAHNNLGLALVQVGRLPEAISHFEQAIRINPDYADPYNNLGVALATAHRPEAAIPCYRKALRLNPDFAAAHFNLGNALASLDRMPEAIACYRDALQLRPNYAEARSNLGAALAQTGRIPEGIAALEEAIRVDPGYVPAHEILGQILSGIGRTEEGRAQLGEAERLSRLKSER